MPWKNWTLDGIVFNFDFDRCSGIFSNPVHIAFPDTMDSGGLAFSANSSKLYISDLTYLYQFNLDSVNIAATLDTVAIYDNFVDSLGYPTLFFYQQLGPDGKIYIASITSTPYLHVIDSPDSAGVACNVIQHGVALKTFNIRSLPLHPNYFLGADSGSVCDTLQLRIKNHVTRNAKIEISVYPNPLQDALHISSRKTKLRRFTIDGKFILQRKLPPWSQLQTIDVSALTNGVYICKLIDENRYSTAQFVIPGFK
ncbi:MAG: T9SS type A sorting domain-containing protein [Bacteroidetes bacterium]|nr:T9SS type A sorting domain-containing protein [Bacteroidota bacterium]